MKAVLLAGLMTLGSVAAYAAADYDSSVPLTEETQASQEAIAEGLIPADQLDAVEYQTVAPEAVTTEALPPGDHRDHRGGGAGPGDGRHDGGSPGDGRRGGARPGDGRRGGGFPGDGRHGGARPGDDRRGGGFPGRDRRPWPRPAPRPFRSWTCSARDRVRVTYTARSYDMYAARSAAMSQCQIHSFVKGCRLLGCARY